MALTYLSYNLAKQIASTPLFTLDVFINNAYHNEYLLFAHHNFFYSKFNDDDIQYHKIETACHCCKSKPKRNYAGVGSLYIYKARVKQEIKTKNRLLLFCKSCVKWRDSKLYSQSISSNQLSHPVQLTLF